MKKEWKKAYETKRKEFKKEGWKLSASSKTLEISLLEHYAHLRDSSSRELVGEVTRFISVNAGKQAAYNNALIAYSSTAGSTLRGRIVSDLNIDQSNAEEFDKMYAAYERLVQQEIRGELAESFTIIKDNGKSKSMRTFFIVNEDKAMQARIRAFKRAAEETALAQRYASKIAAFVREGFETSKE
ncbi:hypothetical protein FACS189435_2650 [Bacteroidia bacterium]|nr:hypothetical protein FACS189435_2650 [Bacteroidia bacterium]